MEDPAQRHRWLDTPEALAEAAAAWRRQPALAIDTEFVRERTFYPRLGLVQLADECASYLVDPLAIEDLTPLAEVLAAPEVVKVAHSCSEDMEVLYHRFGTFPTPLFDTQVGAALAGHEASLSYQKLVLRLLGVELEKGETRTDWLRRPLSPAQLEYASHDVEHLLPVYRHLRAELEPLARLPWVLEESARLEDPNRFLPPPEEAYLRLKGIGNFDRRRLAAIQALAAWRELQARRRDLPRSFVLRDAALLEVVRRQPRTLEELAAIPDVHKKLVERQGEHLLGLLVVAAKRPAHLLPPACPQLPRSEGIKKLLNRLQQLVHAHAEALGVPAPVLASRRDLRDLAQATLAQSALPPPALAGWRWQVLEEPVTVALEKAYADRWLPGRSQVS